jgi:hypothetical protein
MPNERISFEICQHIGVISKRTSGWTKELNIVSWSGNTPKFDLRDWSEDHEHMSRGVTLFADEIRNLVDVYLKYQNQKTVDDAKAERAERRERYENSRRVFNSSEQNSEEDEAVENMLNEKLGSAEDGPSEETAEAETMEAVPLSEEETEAEAAPIPDNMAVTREAVPF